MLTRIGKLCLASCMALSLAGAATTDSLRRLKELN